MTYLVLQTFLLMLTAFFLGALLGCLARILLFGGRAKAPSMEQLADGPQSMPGAGSHSDVTRFERALAGPGSAPAAAPPAAPMRRAADPAPAPTPSPAPSPAPRREAAAPARPVAPVAAPLPPDTLKVAVSTPVSTSSGASAETAAAAAMAAVKVGALPASAPGQIRQAPQRPLPAVEQPKAEVPAAPTPAPSLPAAGGPSAVAAVAADVRILSDDADTPGDDLTRIRGIDAALKGRLYALGVRCFADIAAWTAADVARISAALDLRRTIEQENWIEQAQVLAKGAETQYSRRRAEGGELPLAAAPASVAAGRPATAPPPAADRLQRIAGIDARIERMLLAADVSRYETIAKWTAADVQRFERMIGAPGRISRENWIEQAQILSKGGETAFTRGLDHQPAVVPAASRPARLADAIRENAQRPQAEARIARADLSGMRSVRSEAFRGEGGVRRGPGDDLKRIRGIGVLLEKKLNTLGIDSYEQIANWVAADIDRVSQMLDFKGRIERENWVEQARILASGGQTEFSRRVDRGRKSAEGRVDG